MRSPTKEEELERMKQPLHDFRKEIDALIQKSDGYMKGHTYFREMRIVMIKLQEAKMWTGKCLEALGSELPKEFQDKA